MATTMDSKQLHETGKQIQKALESGDSSSTILTLMSPLSKWTASEDLLRQSKIGVAVAKLRQNKDPKIAEQASKLVHKWKADVGNKGRKVSGSPAPGAKANGAMGRVSGTSSPAPAAVKSEVKKEGRKSTVDPAKRNSKEDGISTSVTGNQTRDSCVKLMYDGLAFMSEESESSTRAHASYRSLTPAQARTKSLKSRGGWSWQRTIASNPRLRQPTSRRCARSSRT